MRFRKKLETFFVYFFTGASVLLIILGIQRTKNSEALAAVTTPPLDDQNNATSSNNQEASILGAFSPDNNTNTVKGVSETISAASKLCATPWGEVGTSIKVKDGKIIAVDVTSLPDSPPSISAKSILIQEALKAGSANIQSVTGATITSKAFIASLENALSIAKSKKGQGSVTNADQTSVAASTSSVIKKVVAALTPAATKKTTVAPAATPTTTDTGTGVTGTFTGNAYSTPWGNAVASVTLVNGVITDVAMPQVPDSPPSQYAEPYLIEQALAAGSANIQGVSGATIVSDAFKSSLESALAKARAKGVVPATQPTKQQPTPPPAAPNQTPTITPPPPPQQTNTTAAPTSVNGTFVGDAFSTPWGNTIASVTVTNGKITNVTMPSVPNSPPSLYAQPYLIAQAIAAGSSNIQGVSGATVVSDAFKASLESALTKARSTGTVVAPAPTTPPPAPPVPPPTVTPPPVTQPTTPPPATAPTSVSGTFKGTPYSTKWGNAEVWATFTNGVLTAVTMPQIPNSPPSQQAAPYLIAQAVAAGSANIQGVSGATVVSNAFKLSLESAIVAASSSGTIATPTPSTTTPPPTTTPAPTTTTHHHHNDD